jgi:transposase-like protein
VVHLIRHSLKYVPRREREQVARDLKPIYTAVDQDAAQAALETFDDQWGSRFPVITQAWLNAWEYVTPFLAFPPELRRVVYTTNAIEALNRQLRKAIKTKGHFPNEEAARKLIYLAIVNAVPAQGRATGRQPCSRSRSTSATDYPSEPPTQKIGRPHAGHNRARDRHQVGVRCSGMNL